MARGQGGSGLADRHLVAMSKRHDGPHTVTPRVTKECRVARAGIIRADDVGYQQDSEPGALQAQVKLHVFARAHRKTVTVALRISEEMASQLRGFRSETEYLCRSRSDVAFGSGSKPKARRAATVGSVEERDEAIDLGI
jgi:hypothetical protein